MPVLGKDRVSRKPLDTAKMIFSLSILIVFNVIFVTAQGSCHQGTKAPRLFNIVVLLFIAMHSFFSDKSVKLIFFYFLCAFVS